MGFYPPDALVHEAQRQGIEVLPPDVNAQRGGVRRVEPVPRRRRVRIGLGLRARGARRADVAALVAAREAAGPVPRPRRPCRARRRGPRGARAARLVGRLRRARGRRPAQRSLWQLGIAAPGRRVPGGHAARAAARAARRRRRSQPLEAWHEMLADYATDRLTVRAPPARAPAPDAARATPSRAPTSTRCRHGRRVRIGGLVVARQRPGTANGIVFLLIEDEHGTINLIVPPAVYERHRAHGAHRAADPRRGPAREACRRRAGRSTCSSTSCARSTPRTARWPRSRTSRSLDEKRAPAPRRPRRRRERDEAEEAATSAPSRRPS